MIIQFQKPIVEHPGFFALTPAAREFAFGYDSIKTIRQICDAHRFNEAQYADAVYINGLAIIKEIEPKDFVSALQDTLRIDTQTAKALASELYNRIIKEAETLNLLYSAPKSNPGLEPSENNRPVQNIAAPIPAPPPPPVAKPTPSTAPIPDQYREPTVVAPLPQPASQPRVSGNVIDLKNRQF